jgi:TonB family protein
MIKTIVAAVLLGFSTGAPTAAIGEQERDVVTAPVVIKGGGPLYPPKAMVERQQGLVKLLVTVRPDGTVGNVRVTQHLSRELDAAAVKAAKQWRFKPGIKNGKAVPVKTAVDMTFTLR